MNPNIRFFFAALAFCTLFATTGCTNDVASLTATATEPKSSDADISGHQSAGRFARAILISVDGMHAIDLAHYSGHHPDSALASLSATGVTFTNARTPFLADSTPGLVSLVAGGSPAVTGLFYSPFYDRSLSPPGSDCSTRGTVYYVDEKWVKDVTREDSGGGIDPEKLARDPDNNCEPVFPRDLIRVNNMFSVVKAAGGRTAWIDQHEMYNDLFKGPAGDTLDDSRALERKGTPGTFAGATAQDSRRMELLLNQIRGFDSTGEQAVGVPQLFGMGFISFGMIQKSAGYRDGHGHMSKELEKTLKHVDQELGRMLAELETQGLRDSTLIILSSKHGQSPIDPLRRRIVDRNVIRESVNGIAPGLLAHATLDTIGLLWLNDSARTNEVVEALRAKQSIAGIQKIYSGDQLNLFLPIGDSRTPDIVLQSELGVFWADSVQSEKTQALMAEHGGMLDEDTNVPLLVSFTGAAASINRTPVHTAQVAPTILAALGLDPNELEAVKLEHTPVLPGLLEAWR